MGRRIKGRRKGDEREEYEDEAGWEEGNMG